MSKQVNLKSSVWSNSPWNARTNVEMQWGFEYWTAQIQGAKKDGRRAQILRKNIYEEELSTKML
jgi:hypothetical protein